MIYELNDSFTSLQVLADELFDEIEDANIGEDAKAELQEITEDISIRAGEALAYLVSV
jgi:hypothetical protein